MHNTHNMGDCKKFNSNSTPKKGFAEKNAQHPSRNDCALHKQNASYVQLSAKIAKLEKSNKKLKQANKKYKRDNSGSNNSDSSWSDGSGSTGKGRQLFGTRDFVLRNHEN